MGDNNVIERKAFIFNKQKYNMYDGPGVRTLVFFKGCPLRSKWCSNPEGLERKYQIMFKPTTYVSCGSFPFVHRRSIVYPLQESISSIAASTASDAVRAWKPAFRML